MSSARGPGRPTAAGGGEPPGAPSALKAVLVLALAVGIGVYLVRLGGPVRLPTSAPSASSAPPAGRPSTTPSTSPPSTPPSTAPSSATTGSPTTTTTTTTAAPGGVQPSTGVTVLVANASQTNGVAGYYTSKLSALGWGTASPVTANIATSTSAVYYVSGQQGAAQSVATSLGLSASAVQPVGTQTPVGQLTPGVDVLVVVGNDLAARVPAGGG